MTAGVNTAQSLRSLANCYLTLALLSSSKFSPFQLKALIKSNGLLSLDIFKSGSELRAAFQCGHLNAKAKFVMSIAFAANI